MNKDLTVGEPNAVLRRFCLPLFGSIIFQQLYNIADSLVAGKFIGENALASVGNSYEVTLIFIAFAFGCNIGCSVVVSQLFGAKDYGRMKTAVSTACIASAVLCLALMAVGMLTCNSLLCLIRTPEEAFADSKLPLSSSTTSQPASSPPWGIPVRLSSSSPRPLRPTSAWTFSLSPCSLWAWLAWPGRRSSARA